MQKKSRLQSVPATKFAVPQVLPHFVPRPRLSSQLQKSLDKRLTIITGPAGFGKTSLIAYWLKSRPEPFVWIQINDDDDEPIRFISSLIAGLRQVHGDFGKTILDTMHAIGSPPLDDTINLIINELSNIDEETLLILDDLHIIQNKDSHRALERLLTFLPLQIHILLISRNIPPVSVSKLRVNRQINEITPRDLTFTPEETRNLLVHKMGLRLSENSINTLFNVTEGWIAGLQMAMLSLRKRENPDAFIAELNGTARDIFDYLDEEVFSMQPDHIRQFLMETSILESFNASLCEAVTGQKNVADRIKFLEAGNLFIFPLDDFRQWYRYHSFFVDGLRQRLASHCDAERLTKLHLAASRWYHDHNDPVSAIRHALSAKDFEAAADIIEPMAETVVRMKEARMLQSWLDAIPEDVILARPVLLLYKALLLADDSQFKQLGNYLDRIEKFAAEKKQAGQSLMAEPVYQGRTLVLRALLACLRFDFDKARRLSETGLELMAGQTCAFTLLALTITGFIAYIEDKPDTARQTFLLVKGLCREMESTTLEYCALAVLYFLEMPLGNLRLLEAMVNETMIAHEKRKDVGENDPSYGLLLILKSIVLLERYQLDEAEKELIRGIRLSKNFMPRIVVALGYIVLAYVFASREKWEDALNAMASGEELFPVIAFPFTFVSQMLKGQVALATGDIKTAEKLLDIKQFNEKFLLKIYEKMGVITYYQLLTQYLIASGKAVEALPVLERIESKTTHHGYILLIIKVMQAMSHHAAGDFKSMVDDMTWALNKAAPEGYIRVFVDQGRPMREIFHLLHQHAFFEDKRVWPFIDKIIVHLDKKYPDQCPPDNFDVKTKAATKKEKTASSIPPGHVPWTYQLDPVSDREIDVLYLIAQGLNNKEIADKLYISVNTVKTHISKILSKLDVKNRTAAVHKARAMGLITRQKNHPFG